MPKLCYVPKRKQKENGKKEGTREKETGKENPLRMNWPGEDWAQEGVPRNTV
jgi:hypothetical protein